MRWVQAVVGDVIPLPALAALRPQMDADAAKILESGGQERNRDRVGADTDRGHLQLGPPRSRAGPYDLNLLGEPFHGRGQDLGPWPV